MKLRRIEASDVAAARVRRTHEVELAAAAIGEEVREGGEAALRRLAERHDGLVEGAPLVIERAACEAALAELDPETRGLLERTAERIRSFARAQRSCLRELRMDAPGGAMGHEIAPLEAVGCYAPGGRYPLPSSILMTAVTARVAGVEHVVVATPRPSGVMLAAAAIAGADRVLACGGAQAVAALALGVGVRAVDLVCGPGNAWVTAAKRHFVGEVGIDMLAGPSELVVVADESADPGVAAADLLAQAEHDVEAVPVLVTDSERVLAAVEEELDRQLQDLPTRAVAEQSLGLRGGVVLVDDLHAAAAACDILAPEHLELHVRDPESLARRIRHFGARFDGRGGEVFGDYGIGPNHVLPTAGGARVTGGLSVFTFLRVRSWLGLRDVPSDVVEDVVAFARLEGLEGHARAAARRGPR